MTGLGATRAQQLVGPCNAAMQRAGITTPKRAAAFLAQVGHESVSLQFKAEIQGSHRHYAPYYGRGFIQLTWERNYRAFGKWLAKGDLFVREPNLVERESMPGYPRSSTGPPTA